MTDTTTDRGLEPLMNIDELADYLGVPVTTIYDWRGLVVNASCSEGAG